MNDRNPSWTMEPVLVVHANKQSKLHPEGRNQEGQPSNQLDDRSASEAGVSKVGGVKSRGDVHAASVWLQRVLFSCPSPKDTQSAENLHHEHAEESCNHDVIT